MFKNDRELLQEVFKEELRKYKKGKKVRANYFGNPKGVIVDIQKPSGLLAPRYKCKWENGDESGWLSSSEITLL